MADKTVNIWVKIKGNAEKALKGVSSQLKKNDTQIKKNGASWKKLAVGVAGVTVAGVAMSRWAKESIRLAQVQETAEKRLSVAYGKNIDGLKKYAAELQKKTTHGDEEIMQAQARLAVFVKDEEQLKALTKASIEFADANEMDLASSFALVGKSVGSSTNALTRYGVKIEGAVGSAERTASAVDSLNKMFGGTAEALAQTSAGQIKQMENEIGDLREEVGEALLPAFIDAKVAVANLYGFIIDNSGTIISVTNKITTGFTNMLNSLDSFWNAKGQWDKDNESSDERAYAWLVKKRLEETEGQKEILKGMKKGTNAYNGQLKIIEKYQERYQIARNLQKGFNENKRKEAELVDESTGAIVDNSAALGENTSAKTKNADAGKEAWRAEADAYFEMQAQIVQGKKDADAQRIVDKETEDADRQTRMDTALSIASATAQGIDSIMSSSNTRKQQEHDNDVARQKEEVKNSTMSAKQKAKAIEKIEKAASKERLKLRVAEWRQTILMSIINTALGVTAALSKQDYAGAAVIAGLGLVETGVIVANKPKFYNGTDGAHSLTGMRGDVIPALIREGETVNTPAQQAEATAGNGTGSFTYSPTLQVPNDATPQTVSTFQRMLDESATQVAGIVEEVVRNGTVNPNIINEALAV